MREGFPREGASMNDNTHRTWAGTAALRHGEPPRADLGKLANGSMLALWRSKVGRDYRTDLATLPVPLLVVLGDGNPLYDTAPLRRWYETTVPGVRVVRYPQADRAPQAAVPARFARDVAAFAARSGSAAAARAAA
jgi:hypothetical protein